MAHLNNKFEMKTKTGRRFHGRGIFFRQRVFVRFNLPSIEAERNKKPPRAET
jgi:hypothetical protein